MQNVEMAGVKILPFFCFFAMSKTIFIVYIAKLAVHIAKLAIVAIFT